MFNITIHLSGLEPLVAVVEKFLALSAPASPVNMQAPAVVQAPQMVTTPAQPQITCAGAAVPPYLVDTQTYNPSLTTGAGHYEQPQGGYQQAPVMGAVVPAAPPVAPPAVPTTAQTFAMDQLAVAATQLVDAGRREELLNLLGQFGVPSLMALPKEQYGNFATVLRQMGAKI